MTIKRRFWKKNEPNKNSNPRELICFNCGEKGHISRECTKPRKDKGPRNSYNNSKDTKVMVAAWGESESDEEPQEGTEDCMMAHKDDIDLLSMIRYVKLTLLKFFCLDPRMNLFT